jgi:alpha/beta superfamily hydrolase
MATMTVDSNAVEIRLSHAEAAFALRRRHLRVPLAAVDDVAVEADGVAAATGLRAPGLAVPGRMKVGTWRRRGQRTLVSTRRGMPAVRVIFSGAGVDEVLIGSPHAHAVATAIRLGAGLPAGGSARQVAIPSGDVTLVGTLEFPEGRGPHPAALILPGSGPLDRDANHRRAPLGVSRDIAAALSGRGIASLRYDRRGAGASGGMFLATGFSDNATDATNALAYLQSHPSIRSDGCLLIGHSEGASLAIAVAGDGRHDDLAGVALLAGSAKTGKETLAWQTRQIVHGLPAPARLVLQALRVDLVAKQAKNVKRLESTTADVERVDGRRMNARWHREFIAFDPKPTLARIGVPVLALTGSKDLQVDPGDLPVIAATVAGPVETVLVGDLTHVLRRDPSPPSLSAYRKLISRPTDREVLDTVAAWASRQVVRSEASG